MIYLGNQTSKYASPLSAPLAFAQEHNFTAFEWFADSDLDNNGNIRGWDFAQADKTTCENLRALSHRIRFSVHANWRANPLTENGINEINVALDFANEINAPIVVVHLCEKDNEIANFTQALSQLMNGRKNVRLAVENTPQHSPEQFNVFFAQLAKLPHNDLIGMTFDVGHANCCATTRHDYLKFIRALSPTVNIIHAHLHENWGDADAHLPLFSGASAQNDSGIKLLIEILLQRNFAGSLILEQWAPEHLVNIVNKLTAMLTAKNAPLAPSSITPNAPIIEAKINGTPPAIAKILLISDNEKIALIVNTMSTQTSWRTRLQWIYHAILEEKFIGMDLSYLAALLRFLATGVLKCAEDGGHYRPNHHAQIGDKIAQLVEQSTAPNWLRRLLYPYLPSNDAQFTTAEPLTRIRDIAHRNDLPHDLKLHIKHQLQNKLHRSAGPEDLITAREILEKITATGANYSTDFVAEFKLFYDELSNFFNAANLPQRLAMISEKIPALSIFCRAVLENKNPPTQIINAVNLRAEIATKLNEPQYWRVLMMADIELENLLFVKLSAALQNPPPIFSDDWLALLDSAMVSAQLSNPELAELPIVRGEIAAWRQNFTAKNRFQGMRWRATLARILRSATAYQEKLFGHFVPAGQDLARALNLPHHVGETLGEAVLRSSSFFQLAKIAENAQAFLRQELNLPAWSIIVGGVTTGKIITLKNLDEFKNFDGENFIVRLAHAEGDEEIPPSISAVILAQPLPQLSHLAIRARQAKVILVVAESAQNFADSATLNNQVAQIIANERGVEIMPANNSTPTNVAKKNHHASVPIIAAPNLASNQIGAKAANVLRLREIAGDLFITPPSSVLPFGTLEKCLSASSFADEYANILARLPQLSEDEIIAQLPRLQAMIMALEVGDLSAIDEKFSPTELLAVRSSSNGEDLPQLAGAGLYDSVIGVTRENLPSAIKKVWASLWTKRAALSRHHLNIAPSTITMAVLIQPALSPDFSFVLHTADPVTGERGKVNIEIAVGLGETLASANQAGRPYHLTADKNNTNLLSCADYSFSYRHDKRELVNYAEISLSTNEEKIFAVAKRLGDIGRYIEEQFSAPQDIEGCMVDDKIYVVQTRPQII